MAGGSRPPGTAAGRQLASRASSPRARTSRSTTRRASGRRSIYALHYAGLIPAGPGKSHQSVRDISLLGALPNCAVVQPGERRGDTRAAALGGRGGDGERRHQARDRAVAAPDRAAPGWRLAARPRHRAARGRRRRALRVRARDAARGARRGRDAARRAASAARRRPCRGSTASTPTWLAETVGRTRTSSSSRTTRRSAGSATRCCASCRVEAARRPSVTAFGVEGWPACGTPPEALRATGSTAPRSPAASASDSALAPRRDERRRPVWLVLPEPLSTRIFFDCGIAERSLEALGAGCSPSRCFRRTRRVSGLAGSTESASLYRDELLPRQRRPLREKALRRADRLARRAHRLLPARDPAQLPSRLPPRAHAARATRTGCSISARARPAAALATARRRMRRWHFSPRR